MLPGQLFQHFLPWGVEDSGYNYSQAYDRISLTNPSHPLFKTTEQFICKVIIRAAIRWSCRSEICVIEPGYLEVNLISFQGFGRSSNNIICV